MNLMESFNHVINYIEQHLEDEIDYEEIAAMFGYSVYHVKRLFVMVAGIPLAEYIRNRRLAKAAVELQGGNNKVIDVAVKYAYSSPTSFNHAFKSFHGVAPSEVKKDSVLIKAYPPLVFDFTIKGAEVMSYRIERKDSFRIVGVKLCTTMTNGECYQATPAFWKDIMKNNRHHQILALHNQVPTGLLGVSNYSPDLSTGEFDYYIACATDQPVPDGMVEFIVPTSTWAVFSCQGTDPHMIQKLEELIVMEWFPISGYQFAKASDIEVYTENGIKEVWHSVVLQ